MTQIIFAGKLSGVKFAKFDWSTLAAGDLVTLVHEAGNIHDANAIAVLHDGNHIGYVPKESTVAIHCAWRNGFYPTSLLLRTNPNDKYPSITIAVSILIPEQTNKTTNRN